MEYTSESSTSGRGVFILQLLGPSLVMACSIGIPFQPHFQVAHVQVVNIVPRALDKKEKAGKAAELRSCLSNYVWAELVPTAAVGLKGELTRYEVLGTQYDTPNNVHSNVFKDVIT